MPDIVIELTEAEKEYIWLLTALDAMRIDSMKSEEQKDYHYQVRHSVRSKLFGQPYNNKIVAELLTVDGNDGHKQTK